MSNNNEDKFDDNKTPLLGAEDSIVEIRTDEESDDVPDPGADTSRRRLSRMSPEARARRATLRSSHSDLRHRSQSMGASGTLEETTSGDVAFTIIVRKEGGEQQNDDGLHNDYESARERYEHDRQAEVDVMQDVVNEAVQEAVTDAVTEAVQEAVQEVVQEAVTEAVQEAVQQAFEDNAFKFDVRANFYTLIAITGVILYWRGVWTMWDYWLGFSIWSEVGAIVTGLAIIISFRFFRLPLMESLPGG